MKKRYIFDTLPTAPDGIEIEGSADIGRIRELVHKGIANGAAPDTGKKRRRFTVLLAAAVAVVLATGVFIFGTILVIGKDNYDYYSSESKNAKQTIESEYNDIYETYLSKLYSGELHEEDYEEYNSNGDMVKLAKNLAVSEMNEKVLDILKEKGYLDSTFTKEDVDNRRDEFIIECCNAFSKEDLSTEEKTRIYIFLDSILEKRDILSGNIISGCGDDVAEKIKETLKIYKDPSVTHTADELKALSEELHISVSEYVYQDPVLLENKYQELQKTKMYRATPEYQFYHKEIAYTDYKKEHYISIACSEYYKEKGINLFKPQTAEEYKAKAEIIAEAYGKTLSDYVEKIDPVLQKIAPDNTVNIDAQRIKANPDYVTEIAEKIFDIVMNSDVELSVEERAVLQVWFNISNAYVYRSQNTDSIVVTGSAKTEAICLMVAEKLAVDENNVILN